MMKMKKLSAVLSVATILVSMLSCVVLGTAAAGALGGPVSIEKAPAATGTGLQVSGVKLDNGILVVDDDWSGKKDDQTVNIKLGGKVYSAVIGKTAFSDIDKAATVAKSNYTIYVAAGKYTAPVSLAGTNHLKIYGPHAGSSPNGADPKDPNLNRPAATMVDYDEVAAKAEELNEAVVTGVFSLNAVQHHTDDFLEVAGLYFADTAYFSLSKNGSYLIAPQLRNNIFSVNSDYIMNMNINEAQSKDENKDHTSGILFENNRVLKGKSLMTVGGLMDCMVRGNYLDLSPLVKKDTGMTEDVSAGAIYVTSFTNPSSGSSIRVEENYFENCSGIVRHNRGTTGYRTANYSIQIRNNEINRVEPGTYLVENMFYAMHSLPGITVQFTGNIVRDITDDTVLFNMPYLESEFNLSRYRYIVNINDNLFELPVGATLINAEQAGIINASDNVFTNGITMSQIKHEEDCDVILYPYYTAVGGTPIGGAIVKSVRDMSIGNSTYSGAVDEAEKKITYDLTGADQDKVDLTKLLVVDDGCTIDVYKEKVLKDNEKIIDAANKVDASAVYLDGRQTTRYVVITAPDGGSSVYTLLVTREIGSEAQLLEVVPHASSYVQVSNNSTEYVIDIQLPEMAFLNYDLNVSAGATVELYDDYDKKLPLTDLGGYIPYDGYSIDVLVRSEDKTNEQLYALHFNRSKSDVYDPSIIEVISPDGQSGVRHIDGKLWMYYMTDGLRKELTFDLKATPGANYAVYADEACTKLLYRSNAVKPLKLEAGVNTVYVKVIDGNESNLVYFEIINDELSNDATIAGIAGNQPRIIANEITLSIGGNSASLTFITSDPYAVCEVYADSTEKLKVEGTVVETPDLYSDRVAKTCSFNLETVHANSKYYVKCIAEDGVTTQLYTLYLTKITNKADYADVAEDDWYASYVEAATSAGLIAGETAGDAQIFRPNDNTTRQEIAVIMSRLIGINGAAYANVALGYKDEAQIAEWALNYVKVCKYNGLMGGSDEGNGIYFFPKKSITREEVMAVFARMLDLKGSYDLSSFADAGQVSGWAKKSVEAVVASGLIIGSDGKLNPKSPITRAEIATIATRALKYIG